MQIVLARDAQSEELLGYAEPFPCVRTPALEQETTGHHTHRERESQVCEHRVRRMGPAPGGSPWISGGNRGSDLFPFWHVCQPVGSDLTMRVAQDRGIAGQEPEHADDPAAQHLTERARQVPPQDVRRLERPATGTRPARPAVVAMGFEAVRRRPPIPHATVSKTPLDLWVVRVWEPLPLLGWSRWNESW
jgi:hypothetical protein